MNASDAGATKLFFGYFKAFITVAFPPPKKYLEFPAPYFWCKLGARRIYNQTHEGDKNGHNPLWRQGRAQRAWVLYAAVPSWGVTVLVRTRSNLFGSGAGSFGCAFQSALVYAFGGKTESTSE